jgi:predicted PurR-regulated permease PerM
MAVIVLAAVVTGIFSPIYKFFKSKIPSHFASLVTCFIIFIVLFIPIILFVGILAKEAYGLFIMGQNAVLSDQLKNLLENTRLFERANLILSKFNVELTGDEFYRSISDIGKYVGRFLFDQANQLAQNILSFLISFFFMLLIIYYLLIDGNRLISFIIDLSPLPNEQDRKLIQKFQDMAGAILIGNGLAGFIQGLLGGAVFAIFGLNSPFLWGVIMSFLAFLPIVGIGVVFLPASIFLFLKGRMGAGIFFIIFYAVLSAGIEYIFKPKLVGDRVQMHTLLVFLAIIGGLKVFGILGIIYGPIIVTAFLTLTDIYHTSYQQLVESTGE